MHLRPRLNSLEKNLFPWFIRVPNTGSSGKFLMTILIHIHEKVGVMKIHTWNTKKVNAISMTKNWPRVDFINPFMLYAKLLLSTPSFYSIHQAFTPQKGRKKAWRSAQNELRPTFKLYKIHPKFLLLANGGRN